MVGRLGGEVGFEALIVLVWVEWRWVVWVAEAAVGYAAGDGEVSVIVAGWECGAGVERAADHGEVA